MKIYLPAHLRIKLTESLFTSLFTCIYITVILPKVYKICLPAGLRGFPKTFEKVCLRLFTSKLAKLIYGSLL